MPNVLAISFHTVADISRTMIEHYTRELLERSGFQRDGFATHYDEFRPRPPADLLDLICAFSGIERPQVVVDLGSGTGLSTRAWADRAEQVVGIEPNSAMCERATAETDAANVRYVEAYSYGTGLADGSVDVVTCSQSLHWMDPEPTFAEAARVLRPGGVFAAYDYDWPPVVHWEVDAAFEEVMRAIERFRAERGSPHTPWRKDEHLARMRASGRFRFAREVVVHDRVEGDADALIALAFTLGPLVVLLNDGLTEDELGVTRVREVAARVIGTRPARWYICYRARLAVK